MIDCVHRLMQLWRTGEQSRVDAYLEGRGLWNNELFARVMQALTELADGGSEERATLESIQNHVRTHGGTRAPRQMDWNWTRRERTSARSWRSRGHREYS